MISVDDLLTFERIQKALVALQLANRGRYILFSERETIRLALKFVIFVKKYIDERSDIHV